MSDKEKLPRRKRAWAIGGGCAVVALGFAAWWLARRTGKAELPVNAVRDLNWGFESHRPTGASRIRIPKEFANKLPKQGKQFVAVVNGKEVPMIRAKGFLDYITSSRAAEKGNATLGDCLREQMGIPNGEPIFEGDLLAHGRNTVTVTRKWNGKVFIDFSNRRNS